MNYAEIKRCDVANGPGVRVSLFVSGCTHHCKECFNKETWDFGFGKPFTQDTIDEILKLLINNGKGLEINTSSFKYGTGTWLPRRSILSRYLNLGGEILTFGSDAHDPFYYQYHFNDAVEFARSIGFRYYCKFHQRKPEFCKLP